MLLDDLIKNTQAEKDFEISKAKHYLKETDWVITKISEAKLENDDITDLLNKYSDIIEERKNAREIINSNE